MEKIKKILNLIKKSGYYPPTYVIESASSDPEVVINGEKYLAFCSNNYFGLANHPKIKEVAKESLERYGVGSGGPRLINGNTLIQEKLERVLADFKHTEGAITFVAGYMANLGVIRAVVDLPLLRLSKLKFLQKKSIIFSDELNHASIIDGCKLSNAEIVVYKHKDMKNLESRLKRCKYKRKRKLIISDGVFSLEGDIAPLPAIVELAEKYNTMIMVDDAHGTGVLGKTGRGICEHFGIDEKKIDIMMGTFTKVFGGVGGYIVGEQYLVDYLKIFARTYMFTAPIAPAVCGGLIATIKEVKDNFQLRERLWNNATYLREGLQDLGFDTLGSETAIVPILVGGESDVIRLSKILFEKKFFAPYQHWPAVPKGKSRIRFTVMATHTKEQIDHLLKVLKDIKAQGGIDINYA